MTSRSDITCDFSAMTGTNLKANCAYFESKKNALYIFPALLRLRVVFYRYPTTRNKKKIFRVICTLRARRKKKRGQGGEISIPVLETNDELEEKLKLKITSGEYTV